VPNRNFLHVRLGCTETLQNLYTSIKHYVGYGMDAAAIARHICVTLYRAANPLSSLSIIQEFSLVSSLPSCRLLIHRVANVSLDRCFSSLWAMERASAKASQHSTYPFEKLGLSISKLMHVSMPKTDKYGMIYVYIRTCLVKLQASMLKSRHARFCNVCRYCWFVVCCEFVIVWSHANHLCSSTL
jgi:hypothetical protein